MTRATPQAAADLMSLLRIVADPAAVQKHIEDIRAEYGNQRTELDTRQAALDDREKDLNAAKAINAGVTQACDARQKALSDREVALNAQAADIELRVRNHGVDVAKFRDEVTAHELLKASVQADLDTQRADLKKREDEHLMSSELLDARTTAVNVREAEVQQAAEALDERQRKLKAALEAQ